MSFREKFLEQASVYRKKQVDIEGIGAVEIREPSAKRRSDIYKEATVVKGTGRDQQTISDPGKLSAYAIIFMAVDVETGKPVFDKADLDTLLNLPSTIFDKLAKPALEFLGEDEDAEKNS